MTEWIITSSALIAIIIALRFVLKGKISLRLQYGLWALVLIRLLLPFSIAESAVSVSNLLSAPAIRQADEAVSDYKDSYQTVLTDYAQRGEETDPDTLRQQVKQELLNRTQQKLETQYAQAGAALDRSEVQMEIRTEAQQQVEVISLAATVTDVLPYLWLGGVLLFAAVLAGCNLHFWWKLRKSRKEVNMPDISLKAFQTDHVATPCLFGIGRPAVYLTREAMIDSRMREHVLAHEMSHYRQGDHIWSVLRCVCLALHWYNPLVWAAAILSKQDAELACDEATIKRLGEDQRLAYGRTLVGMTCVRRDPASMMLTATTMQGTKETLKERITLIARRPKTALYTLIACVLVTAMAVGCTFTGAPVESIDPTTKPTTEPTTEPTVEPTDLPTTEPTVFDPEDVKKQSEAELLFISLRAAAAACDQVDVSFYSMGQVTKWQLDASKLPAWREWVDNLSLTLLSEDKVAELQMTEGGESYSFKINGGEASFTFKDHGLDHYLVIEGTYYEVLNGMIPEFLSTDTTLKTDEAKEIAKYQELLREEWIQRIIGCIFEEPEDISLEYMFYLGLPHEEREDPSQYSQTEIDLLKDALRDTFWGEEAWEGAHKFPAERLNEILNQYLGVSLADVEIPETWIYLAETDAYYDVRTDAYSVSPNVTGVNTDENGLIYVYWTTSYICATQYTEEMVVLYDPQMVTVLEMQPDGSYRVLMNMAVSSTDPQIPAASAGFGAVYIDICCLLDTGSWDLEYTYANTGMMELVGVESNKEARYSSITYALEDMDGDGAPEMIVLDAQGNTRILAIFAIQDGEPVMTHEGWNRSRLYRLSDGSLYRESSGGAAYSVFEAYGQRWFTYPKGEDQTEIGYYYAADGSYDPATSQEITADEYNAKQAELAQEITEFTGYPFI